MTSVSISNNLEGKPKPGTLTQRARCGMLAVFIGWQFNKQRSFGETEHDLLR